MAKAKSLTQREPVTQFFSSGDAGRTFREISTDYHLVDIAMSPSGDDSVLGITDKGKLTRSSDDGKSWSVVKDIGVSCTDKDSCMLFISPKGTIFVYGGRHFIRVGNRKPVIEKFRLVEDMYMSPFGDLLMTVVAFDEYEHVLISDDDGLTWRRYFDSDHDSRFYISPRGTLFLRAVDNRSHNTKYFRLSRDMVRRNDLPFTSISSLMNSPSGNILAHGIHEGDSEPDDFMSHDDGLTWERIIRKEDITRLLNNDREGSIIITEQKRQLLRYKSKLRYPAWNEFIIVCRLAGLPPILECSRNDHELPSDLEAAWRKELGVEERFRTLVRKVTDGTYLLLSPRGLYRTADEGLTWKQTLSSYLPSGTRILMNPRQTHKVYLIRVEWPAL